MVKYIIHVGPRRTGSKYIQSQLFHSRRYLEEHGVLYPDIWWKKPDKVMHDSVRDGLRAGKDLKTDFDKLNASRAEIIILSFEGFADLKLPALEQLKEYTAGNPVEIVYYVRRWTDRLPSDWRGRLSAGNYLTIPEFCIQQLTSPEDVESINYSIVWKRFAKVFGRDSLRIVSFSNLVDHGVDLFEHFCQDIVGVRDVPPVVKGLIQRNAGPDMIDAEIMRAMNYLYYVETARTDASMRIKFNKLKEKYDLQALREQMKTDMGLRTETRWIKLRDEKALLRPAWQAMRLYKDRLVSPQYGEDMFERRVVDVEYVAQNYLLLEGMLDEVTKLYHFVKFGQVQAPDLEALQQPPHESDREVRLV